MDSDWLREVNRLKEKATEFIRLFNQLKELEPYARADSASSVKFQVLMDAATAIKSRISYVTGLIDKVFDWFTDQGSTPSNTVQGLGELGILWLPVIVVVGLIAAITSWSSDAYVQVKELTAVRELINQGVSSADAYRLIREKQPGVVGSFFQGIQKNFILFSALGLAAYYLPRYLKGRR